MNITIFENIDQWLDYKLLSEIPSIYTFVSLSLVNRHYYDIIRQTSRYKSSMKKVDYSDNGQIKHFIEFDTVDDFISICSVDDYKTTIFKYLVMYKPSNIYNYCIVNRIFEKKIITRTAIRYCIILLFFPNSDQLAKCDCTFKEQMANKENLLREYESLKNPSVLSKFVLKYCSKWNFLCSIDEHYIYSLYYSNVKYLLKDSVWQNNLLIAQHTNRYQIEIFYRITVTNVKDFIYLLGTIDQYPYVRKVLITTLIETNLLLTTNAVFGSICNYLLENFTNQLRECVTNAIKKIFQYFSNNYESRFNEICRRFGNIVVWEELDCLVNFKFSGVHQMVYYFELIVDRLSRNMLVDNTIMSQIKKLFKKYPIDPHYVGYSRLNKLYSSLTDAMGIDEDEKYVNRWGPRCSSSLAQIYENCKRDVDFETLIAVDALSFDADWFMRQKLLSGDQYSIYDFVIYSKHGQEHSSNLLQIIYEALNKINPNISTEERDLIVYSFTNSTNIDNFKWFQKTFDYCSTPNIFLCQAISNLIICYEGLEHISYVIDKLSNFYKFIVLIMVIYSFVFARKYINCGALFRCNKHILEQNINDFVRSNGEDYDTFRVMAKSLHTIKTKKIGEKYTSIQIPIFTKNICLPCFIFEEIESWQNKISNNEKIGVLILKFLSKFDYKNIHTRDIHAGNILRRLGYF